MKKYIIYVITLVILGASFFTCIQGTTQSELTTEKHQQNIFSEMLIISAAGSEQLQLTPKATKRVKTNDLKKLKTLMNESQKRIDGATAMEKAAKQLKYEDEHPVVSLAKKEKSLAKKDYQYYKELYDKITKQQKDKEWEKKAAAYPTAAKIWKYLKSKGYNDYVCAGIIGNMMTEAGGQTLKIQANIYNPSKAYYGICQWSKQYHPKVYGKDLNTQLDYLNSTLKTEMNNFGYKYAKGFNYESFKKLTSTTNAASAFAKCYERCGSGSYQKRIENAKKAYDYFH